MGVFLTLHQPRCPRDGGWLSFALSLIEGFDLELAISKASYIMVIA